MKYGSQQAASHVIIISLFYLIQNQNPLFNLNSNNNIYNRYIKATVKNHRPTQTRHSIYWMSRLWDAARNMIFRIPKFICGSKKRKYKSIYVSKCYRRPLYGYPVMAWYEIYPLVTSEVIILAKKIFFMTVIWKERILF